jgi:peptide/nickel transport system substrate-binding protein
MLRRGEADIASRLADVLYEDVKRDPKLRSATPYSPNRLLLYMASQWDPKSPWSDPRVRKAASLSIDRQTLADVHMPGCGPIGSLGLPGDPMAVDFPADTYDPERAKKLLADAGYPKGFHGGIYYPYDESYRTMGEQIGHYLKAVGITLDTRLLDRPAWHANRQGGKMKGSVFFDPCIAPTIGGRLSYLFGSTSYGNYPDIQALWDQYQREYAPNIRKDLIARIQRLIYEKTMYIPLTSVNSPGALGPKVRGNPFKVQPLIWFTTPFEDIELNN